MYITILLTLCACKDPPAPPKREPPPAPADAAPPTAQPAWVVDLGPRAPRPEIAAHAPVVVGELILIAGSRVGYLAVDRARGQVAWRRPGGTQLSAPLVLAHDDVVLVRECDEAVGAPLGHAVLACLDRVDPAAIAARTAERIFVREDSVGDCLAAAGSGPWSLTGTDPQALTLARGLCRFTLELPGGRATRIADAPVPAALADDEVFAEGDEAVWLQVIAGSQSRVVRRPSTRPPGGLARGSREGARDDGPSFRARDVHSAVEGPQLRGLTVLAAARVRGRDAGAVVVRADASLRNDYLAAYDGGRTAWVWPLPEPPVEDGGRGGPIAVSATDTEVYVFFDGSRVARFTAPWAAPTAP